jgi:hypothetical protein
MLLGALAREPKMRADAAAVVTAVAVVHDAQAGEQEETKEDKTAESLRVCSYCESAHDSMRTLRQCSRCKTVRYCDRGCQRAHWKAHKAQCDRESTVTKEREKENRIQQAGFNKDEDKGTDSTVIVGKVPPHEFQCPITLDLIVDPVVAADGHTYERQAILDWFRETGQNTRSPTTSLPLTDQTLRPNFAMRSMIADWQGQDISNTASAPAPALASLEPSAPPPAVPLAAPEQQDPSTSVHDWLVSVNPALSVYAAPLSAEVRLRQCGAAAAVRRG